MRILCLYERYQIGQEERAEILELMKEREGKADARIEASLKEIIPTLNHFVQSRLSADEILGLALCVSVYVSTSRT